MDVEQLRQVRLLGVPARLHLANLALLRDLLHELRLVRAGQESGQLPADTELADLIDGILAAYATATDATEEQAEAAVCRGCEVVDIEIELAPAAATASSTLLDLLERADELCRSERLLTLPAPPEVARLRRWMNEQIEAQLARGDPPAPFSG